MPHHTPERYIVKTRLIAAVAVLGLLAGCSQPQPSTAGSTSPSGTGTTHANRAQPSAGTGSASPSGTTGATQAEEPDCRGAKDTRSDAARDEPFTVCGVALINKKHRVSSAFVPKLVTVDVPANGISRVRLQPVAGEAVKKLVAAADADGISLVVRYAYRSYATQKYWYTHYNTGYTAPAGASEHQSGLAVDFAGIANGQLVRGEALERSPIGTWLARHAPQYGFILRYPGDQSKITGIAYEPWHFRYVGTEVAKGVAATKTKTLEQYLDEL